jgi:type 1 glutamine amidotransferase
MMSKVKLVCLSLFVLFLSAASLCAQAKIQVLLLTGDDVAPAHNWREMAEATREALVNSGKFEVRVSEDPSILESSRLSTYDLIFFTLYNSKLPAPTEKAKENLVNFVKSGKGFAVSHLASASYKDWPEFQQMCGRYWVMGTSGHGPRSVFKAKVVNKAHPVTKGVSDFETDDELYAKLQGTAPVEVLVEADSDWSKKTEPLVFVQPYGQGRVFYEAFGHDRKAIMNPAVQKLIVQGCEWAATGQVK